MLAPLTRNRKYARGCCGVLIRWGLIPLLSIIYWVYKNIINCETIMLHYIGQLPVFTNTGAYVHGACIRTREASAPPSCIFQVLCCLTIAHRADLALGTCIQLCLGIFIINKTIPQ